MRACLVTDPSEFLEVAGPLLTADEARHNLILGLASTLDEHPSLYADHRLWVVESAGAVVAAALRTPPRGLVLARPASDEALIALVSAIDDELPGVVGARPEVEAFADLWAAKANATTHVRAQQGIYMLSTVLPTAEPSGAPRLANRDDRPLLLAWWHAFVVEAMHESDPDLDEIERAVDYRLGEETAPGTVSSLPPSTGFLLWDDREMVSLAGFGGQTPNGIRIGPVYTPPGLRGRGYASALVAALSERCLAAGNRFCFLYTDLANPTSNAIYRRIGYEQVCESAEIEFT